jgi:hypothetical protein
MRARPGLVKLVGFFLDPKIILEQVFTTPPGSICIPDPETISGSGHPKWSRKQLDCLGFSDYCDELNRADLPAAVR